MAKKYQYRYVTENSYLNLLTILNELGENGWELVNYHFNNAYYHGILKMEI